MEANDQFIPKSELGERLRSAREQSGLTQSEVAINLSLSRTTLLAIEQGQRKIKIDELQLLAKLYKTSVNELLRRESVFINLVPQFRKLNTKGNEHIEHAAKVLNALVCTEVELENVLGVKRSFFTVPEYPILPGNTAIQAEQDALNLRFALGFGDISGLDLLKIVDMQLGIRIYYRQLHSSISGLFAFDESVGACMLLNSSHPFVRQNHTAAHELGHYVSSRSQPEALVENALSETRSERYAGCFARGFLMPKDLVKRAFLSLTAGQSHFTRRHVILLADIFQVSREAVVRRLEELSIIKKGTWDWFLINGGITDDQAKNVLQTETNAISEENSTKNLVPERLKLLIRESAKRDLYSEGQLARMLWLDRQSVRALLDDLESETSIDDKFRIS